MCRLYTNVNYVCMHPRSLHMALKSNSDKLIGLSQSGSMCH